jgi:hypothetical protein
VAGCGLDLFGLGYGPVASTSEHSYEPLGFIIGGEFLDQLIKNFSLWI